MAEVWPRPCRGHTEAETSVILVEVEVWPVPGLDLDYASVSARYGMVSAPASGLVLYQS